MQKQAAVCEIEKDDCHFKVWKEGVERGGGGSWTFFSLSNGVFLGDDVNDSGAGWPPNSSFFSRIAHDVTATRLREPVSTTHGVFHERHTGGSDRWGHGNM